MFAYYFFNNNNMSIMDSEPAKDINVGLEMILMAQEQVVSEYRELVSKDLAHAAIRYAEFAQRLDDVSSGGNAQIRSLVGGPDSLDRAELIDVLVGSYSTASDDVKEKVLELVTGPLLRDNYFYVRKAIVQMKNPYIIADIIRKHPESNPGAGFYEYGLRTNTHLSSPQTIQAWLNKFGDSNFYAAMAVALQRSNAADVEIVIDANQRLFEGAAHIVASHHDFLSDQKIASDPSLSKPELLEKYRSRFVRGFASLVKQKVEEANWLPAASI